MFFSSNIHNSISTFYNQQLSLPDAKRRAVSLPGSNQPVSVPVAAPVPVATSKPNDLTSKKPLEKVHCDSIVNYLLKLACQVLLILIRSVKFTLNYVLTLNDNS